MSAEKKKQRALDPGRPELGQREVAQQPGAQGPVLVPLMPFLRITPVFLLLLKHVSLLALHSMDDDTEPCRAHVEKTYVVCSHRGPALILKISFEN